MTNFYKGTIVNVNKFGKRDYNLDIVKEDNDEFIRNFHYYLNLLSSAKIDVNKKNEIDKIIIDMLNPKPTNEKGKDIIYRKIYDDKGNVYGRELVTNVVFPINNEYSHYNINYSKVVLNEIYYDVLNNEVYAIMNPDAEGICLLGKEYKRETYLPMSLADEVYNINANGKKEIIIGDKVYDLMCLIASNLKIEIEPRMSFPNNQVINYAITNEEKANSLEVRNYCETYEKGFGKRQREKVLCQTMNLMCMHNNLGNISFVRSEDEPQQRLIKKM